MVSLDWHLRRAGRVTLVELVVHSPYDAEVLLTSNLTPVWPPRRRGRPAVGWDGSQFTSAVRAGCRAVVGYATPAEPAEPPATVTTHRPLTETTSAKPTPTELIQSLGDGSPPSDAVPSPNALPSHEHPHHGDSGRRNTPPAPSASGQNITPGADTVETRLQAAERLTSAKTVPEAQAAVAATGGIDAVRALVKQLETDRLQNHHPAIKTRLAAVDIPLASLERLV